MKCLGIRELRANLGNILQTVADHRTPYTICRHGHELAYLTPAPPSGSERKEKFQTVWAVIAGYRLVPERQNSVPNFPAFELEFVLAGGLEATYQMRNWCFDSDGRFTPSADQAGAAARLMPGLTTAELEADGIKVLLGKWVQLTVIPPEVCLILCPVKTEP